jgi:hypothetical protein
MLLAILRGFVLCLLILLPASAQDTAGVGSLAGTVADESGNVLANVKICLVENQRCATSDTSGSFRLNDVRPGQYQIDITAPAIPTFRREGIEVRAGLEGKVEIVIPTVNATRQELTVTESAFVAPEEVKGSAYLIQPREVSKTAGSLQDVSRYLQTLPGVVFGANDFRNDIIVRGGSPLENLFIIDNIEIPNINNFANFASAGGPVSMLDAELINDVTFLTGGYPSPYINRLSSVLQVAQREGDREQFRGRATVGFAGAGTILEGPIKKEKGSWVVSVRRSFLDFFTDDIGFGGVPVNYSINAKGLYDLSPRDRIWFVNISGVDSIRIRPDGVSEDQQTNIFNINYDGWRSASGLNWQRLFGNSGVGLLGLTHSEAKVGSRVGDQLLNDATVYRENSREGESTIKYDLTLYAPMINKVQAGGSFKIFRLNYNATQPIGNENPYTLVPRVNNFALVQSFLAYQSGAYFQTSQNLTRRLSFTWGGRFDNYQYIGASRFSPRVALAYRINDKLSWRASYGTYYQQPFFLFLSAYPENRGLAPIRADHYVSGFTYVFDSTTRLTLEGYYKTYSNYPVALEYPSFSLANAGDTFAVRNLLFPLTAAGRGRVRGIELFLERKFSSKWFGQTNLSFQRTRHAGLDGIYRPGSFDYPYVFNAVGGYRLNPKWEFSARFVALGGRPFTPFDEPNSIAQNRPIFDLDRVNGERAPDYLRLDVRADRTFTFRDKPLLVFIGVQNVTNRRNFAQLDWNRRVGRAQIDEQQGLFPLIGLDWRF